MGLSPLTRAGLLVALTPLVACTWLIELDGPPSVIPVRDVGADAEPPVVDAGPPAVDAAADQQWIDATFIDAAPPGYRVTDLRGTGGRHDGTSWEGRTLHLEAGRRLGEFTSRIFEVEEDVVWSVIRWYPLLAYGRALPDAGATERGYPEGNLDMSNNVLLLHLDQPRFADGRAVFETSGSGHAARAVGGDGALAEAVFGGGFPLTGSNWIEVDAQHPAFRFGVGDFTWSAFVRVQEGAEETGVLMSGEMGVLPGLSRVWWGDRTDCQVPGLGGRIQQIDGDGFSGCTGAALGRDSWQHVAWIKTGHTPAHFRWYIDGEQVAEHPDVELGDQGIDLNGAEAFTIGAFPNGLQPISGALDEVALWHRALDADELKAIATRGLSRVTVRVRACVTPECSADPPWGPPLTDDFTGEDGVVEKPLALGPTRWIQYAVRLEGPPSLSPRVLRVELQAQPEPEQ